jgi:hypothetical protein
MVIEYGAQFKRKAYKMIVDLENPNPGTWFDLPDEGRISLKTLSLEELSDIRKKAVKNKVEYKQGQRFEFDDIDEDKIFNLSAQSFIVEWEGIKTKDGIEMPCTNDNKVLLMRKAPSFSKFVKKCLEELNRLQEEETEIERKNS